MEFRTLTEGLQFPEGPVALADGSVLLVEIAAGTLTRVAPDGTKTVVAHTGGGPNGAAIGPDGKCYVANNGGFEWHREEGRIRPLAQAKDYSGGRLERVDLATGAVEMLYRACGEVPLKGPNDLVFDAQGGIYFTDLGKRRARDMDVGGVYYAKPDGSSIVEVAYPMMTPNGIGLSPDEQHALCRRDRGGAALGVSDRRAGRRQERPVAVAAWRPARRRHGRLSALRLAGGAGGRPHLRRDPGQWRHHRDLAGRPPCRAPPDARPDDDQHLLRRPGHEDRVHHAVLDRTARRGRLADRRV